MSLHTVKPSNKGHIVVHIQAYSQDLLKGVTWMFVMYVYIRKHTKLGGGLGYAPPGNF